MRKILILILLIAGSLQAQVQPFAFRSGGQFALDFDGSTTISFVLRGTGNIRINWGNGSYTDTTLTSSDKTITKNYGSATTGTIKISNPDNVTKFYFSGDYKLRVQLYEIAKMKNLDTLYMVSTTSNNNLVYGDLSSLPTGLTYLYLGNLGTNLTGSISSLPTGLTYLYLINLGNSIVIDTGSMKAWTNTEIAITPQTSYGYTTAQVDGFLNAWALVAEKSTSKTIDLRGANQPRSSASDTAVDTLTTRLKVILTNP